MKYIQTYEDYYRGYLWSKYKVGDYVKLDRVEPYTRAKILEIITRPYDDRLIVFTPRYFRVQYVDDTNSMIMKEIIQRRLTKEEIQQFELEKDAKNYNL